jgi:hypothetical protein
MARPDHRPMLTPATTPLSPRTQRHAATRLPMPPPGRFLAVEHGPELLLLPLAGAVTTIGRSPAADVELDDHRVAARHAAVVVRDGRVVLVGRGAPVEVNGAAVDEAELRDGDHITIGATRLILVDHAPPARLSRGGRSAAPR